MTTATDPIKAAVEGQLRGVYALASSDLLRSGTISREMSRSMQQAEDAAHSVGLDATGIKAEYEWPD